MSVWTRMKSQVLEEKVNMEYFTEAMKELEITLDFSVKEISNYYGSDKVDAMIRYQGNSTALGILQNAKGGVDVLGDTYRSGIVKDKQHGKLVNMMAQAYQTYKTKKQLELAGWTVTTKKVEDKIELTCEQW